jgi:hypothetical protein
MSRAMWPLPAALNREEDDRVAPRLLRVTIGIMNMFCPCAF